MALQKEENAACGEGERVSSILSKREREKKETPKWKSFLLQKILQLRGALMQQARHGRNSVCIERHRLDINSPSFCALIRVLYTSESESDRPYLNFIPQCHILFG